MQKLSIAKSSISKQIAEQLREAIVNGRFKIDERLPTEDVLAKRYGVSRPSEPLIKSGRIRGSLASGKHSSDSQRRTCCVHDEAFCQAEVTFHRALVDTSGNGMLRFVMYTVIEALIPVTIMVVTVVRERSDIISLHEQMLEHLRHKNNRQLIGKMNELLDYLLEKFELATQR